MPLRVNTSFCCLLTHQGYYDGSEEIACVQMSGHNQCLVRKVVCAAEIIMFLNQ